MSESWWPFARAALIRLMMPEGESELILALNDCVIGIQRGVPRPQAEYPVGSAAAAHERGLDAGNLEGDGGIRCFVDQL